MPISLTTLLETLSSIFRSRAALGFENLALRHQVDEKTTVTKLPHPSESQRQILKALAVTLPAK